MAVHFPIALFLAALMAELISIATRNGLLGHTVRFCVRGGALAAAIAAPLGWVFAASGATEEGWILDAHRWTGVGVAIFGLALLWLCERTERLNESRWPLRTALVIQAGLVSSAGFLGGSLLYGIDHLWRGI